MPSNVRTGHKAMKLQTKRFVDYFLGVPLLALLGIIGRLSHFGHLRKDSRIQDGTVLIVKLQGGGSLVLALPTLLALKNAGRYSLEVLVTPSVKPFAEALGVFSQIHVINDRSIFSLGISGVMAMYKCRKANIVVDLEVFSRLTSAFTFLTGAPVRISFYVDDLFLRKGVATHLIFFNRTKGVYSQYEQIATLLNVKPCTYLECRIYLTAKFQGVSATTESTYRISVGPGSSEFGTERRLTISQWLEVIPKYLPAGHKIELILLGGTQEKEFSASLASAIRVSFPGLIVCDFAGKLSLRETLYTLKSCNEYWGIDSGLLHFARLLINKTVSFWGPTDPSTRLQACPSVVDIIEYNPIGCSPCIHVAENAPCLGNNLCIASLFKNISEQEILKNTILVPSPLRSRLYTTKLNNKESD